MPAGGISGVDVAFNRGIVSPHHSVSGVVTRVEEFREMVLM